MKTKKSQSEKNTLGGINNLPDVEFKTLVIRMLDKLRGRVEELSENFNKEMQNIKMEIENKRESVRKEYLRRNQQ